MLPIPHHGLIAIVAQHPTTVSAKGQKKRHTAHAWLDVQDVRDGAPAFQAALDWAQACNAAGSDIFFTTGGFAGDLDEYTGRSAANVVAQRSLFLDLDCAKWGIDAGTTGFDAVFGWIEANENLLVPSLVINSGGGLHVYFIADQDIPLDRWHAAADQLRNGAKQVFHDAVDVQCTIDRARILRVPGFVNTKYPALVEQMWPFGDHEQPLYTIEQLEAMVAPWPRTAAALGKSVNTDFANALGLGGATVAPGVTSAFADAGKSEPASWSRMAQAAQNGEGCGVLAAAMQDSSTVGYDDWCGLLTIINCTDDFEAGAHAVSKDHPDWGDTQDVDTAFAKASSFGGPRRCSSFSHPACSTCRHSGRITSPVEIGRTHVKLGKAVVEVVVQAGPEAEPEVFVLPEPPHKYIYDHKGAPGVFLVDYKSTENGAREVEIQQLWDAPVWVDSHAHGDGKAHGKLAFFNQAGDIVRLHYNGYAADLGEQMKVVKGLVDMGLGALRLSGKAGIDAHTAFIAALTAQRPNSASVVNQFGPENKEDDSGFSLGEVRYRTDGKVVPIKVNPAAPGAKTVSAGLLPRLPGAAEVQTNIAEWNAHLRTVHGVRPGLHNPVRALDRLLVASGFGAVLPLFTEDSTHRGGYVSLMSNAAGSGKTSMVTAALSIYARQVESLVVSGTTENGWRGQAWAACALPVVLDDFWQNDRRGDMADRVKKMLLGSTSRSSRATMLGDNESFTSTWTYMTGNKDVASEIAVEDAAAGGALRRMFNIQVPTRNPSHEEAKQYERFKRWCAQNGGVVGHVWVQHVVTHVEQLRERRDHWEARLTQESEPLRNQQYEFVRAILANTLAGADVAGQLGLHPYSMTDLLTTAVSYAQQSWDAMTDAIVADDNILSDLLTRAAKYTITANRNGNRNFSSDRLPSIAQTMVRRYPDTGEVAISAAGLRALCSEARIQVSRAKADLANYPHHTVTMDLGEGTSMIGLQQLCYLIQLPTTPVTTKESS